MRSCIQLTASGSTARRARQSASESTTVNVLELGVGEWLMGDMIPGRLMYDPQKELMRNI